MSAVMYRGISEMDEPDDPRFVQFTERGRVHILAGYVPFSEGLGLDPAPDSMLDAILSHEKALCGARGPSGGMSGVHAFPDDLLCRRCYQAWPFSSNLLFEHDQGGEW